jgi:hypothetical protein
MVRRFRIYWKRRRSRNKPLNSSQILLKISRTARAKMQLAKNNNGNINDVAGFQFLPHSGIAPKVSTHNVCINRDAAHCLSRFAHTARQSGAETRPLRLATCNLPYPPMRFDCWRREFGATAERTPPLARPRPAAVASTLQSPSRFGSCAQQCTLSVKLIQGRRNRHAFIHRCKRDSCHPTHCRSARRLARICVRVSRERGTPPARGCKDGPTVP